ncbi:DUF5606 family protein [Persicitalea jodogahamensis]|uniref:DUF5606 domain-containing protein n=1 Tax=Persicitalea jodogahamensis TaxID=402147 RepID=A0A8J3G7J9_9BACT|nr:DUF5606 domain-containing protein [Persicitalea jodogahamensis]GHB56101.1 hypothetical protein GCM10007390_06730 [Persicitalea jodogahamensis]
MEILKEIANVSGKGGLYRILKPSRAGVIVESLDGKGEKTMIGASARVSVLKDVSIFTEGEQDSIPLSDVFLKIRKKHGEKVDIDLKQASDKNLIEFLDEVLPEFDRGRVYVSDIKKIIQWYNTLSAHFPNDFVKSPPKKKTIVVSTEGKSSDESEADDTSEESEAPDTK